MKSRISHIKYSGAFTKSIFSLATQDFCTFRWPYVQLQAPKTAAYYISPIEIGVLWATITYVKSHSKAMGFRLQTDMK